MRSLIAALVAVAASGTAQVITNLSITNTHLTGKALTFSWDNSATGLAYSVHFQETVEDGIWRLAASELPFPITTNYWTAPAINATRFYRVVSAPAAQRAKPLEITLTGTLQPSMLATIFLLAGIPITPQYGVRQYRVVYETIGPLGARTIGSGALLLPEGAAQALPLVSYQHGTIVETNKAPSSMNLSTEVTVGVAFASTGYAAVVPDYLGLGSSPGLHPYHHARSQATAGVDLLRVARDFCATNGVALSGKLFLCGYSQGGHATVALLRELEAFHTNEFTVTACAAAAGAYDLSGVTTEDFLSGRVQPNPYYFLYMLGAYQEVYRFASRLADLLAAPYNTTLPPLLQGNASGTQINAAMPADPVQILKPAILTEFRSNPRHPLRLALQDNDLYRWRPHAPLRLYHCAGDRDVMPANSQVAYAEFQALGATQVQLIDPLPTANHGGCVQPSLQGAKGWFDSLR